MPAVSLRLEGFDELLQQLHQMEAAVEHRLAQEAVDAGAAVVLAQAIANVPVDTGNLKQLLKIRRPKKRSRSRAAALVGTGTQYTSRGYAAGRQDDFYGSFVEYGHFLGKRHARRTPGSPLGARGQQRKWVPPKPFLRPAVDSKRGEAIEIMRSVLAAGIEAAARR